jgi:hypothetical protein
MKLQPLAYNEKETSEIIRISVSALQKSRKSPYTNIINGKCPPFYKNGGSVFYRKSDVIDFMDNRKIIGKPEAKSQSIEDKSYSMPQKAVVNNPVNPFEERLKF